jgi:Na+/phosphate symporter
MEEKYMEEREYQATLTQVFDAMMSCIDQVIKCVSTHDKKWLEGAEKDFFTAATASLPLADRLTKQQQRGELEKKFLSLLPTLQKAGLAMDDLLSRMRRKVDAGMLFTDKANAEITDIMKRVTDLTRDTKDIFITKNPRLLNNVRADSEKLIGLSDEYALKHQERMIAGVCTPRASYIYVDMMESLKRMATHLVSLAEQA